MHTTILIHPKFNPWEIFFEQPFGYKLNEVLENKDNDLEKSYFY